MGCMRDYKPMIAMFALQVTSAVASLSIRAALIRGLNPRVFVVYRQAIATLFIAPIAYFSERKSTTKSSLTVRSFCLMFLASLVGITMDQIMYFEGLRLASSSIATAMTNLVPAITFLIAAFVGLEKVDMRSLRSISKVVGTVVCVGGAFLMAFIKGPKLLDKKLRPPNIVLHPREENWMMGCVLLFGSSCCWSLWLILQVPILAQYPSKLCLSAWMFFLATLQSSVITFFLEKEPGAWNLHSSFELLCCLYSGIVGSSVAVCVQIWCISRRGPLFCAMFNPLSMVIVTILGCILLHEEIYVGSFSGSILVVGGLYVVIWGKAKDIENTQREANLNPGNGSTNIANESSKKCCKIDLSEPLLVENLSEVT